jgi:chorismate synthase
MNTFGRHFRLSIFGESHGPLVGITIDGCPAGIPLDAADFQEDMERRKGGMQKGTTPRKEDDMPVFQSGLFNGFTTGAPLTMVFPNANTRSADYEKQRDIPRPGHADFVARRKYGGFEDFRGGGHFSGRLTACLVAAGVVAKKMIAPVQVRAGILELGGEGNVEAGLQKAIEAKDSVGGILFCEATDLPLGLGEPFFDSVESLISHAVFSIPAIKGIEFGAGFAAARMFGSEHNDALLNNSGQTRTNHAGGVVGGISSGNPLYFRVAVKPTSSTPKEQFSLNWQTGEVESFSVKGRHDLSIALRVPPVLEAVTAVVLADLLLLDGRLPRINQAGR